MTARDLEGPPANLAVLFLLWELLGQYDLVASGALPA